MPRQLSEAITSRTIGAIIVACIAVTYPAEKTSPASLWISTASEAGAPGGSLPLPWFGLAAWPSWADLADLEMNWLLACGGNQPPPVAPGGRGGAESPVCSRGAAA